MEPLKKDVSRVFANAISYYGPDGAGRRLHEPSDCDDYVQRAQRFDDAWTSVAKTLKNPGREVKSPTPKKDVNLAALRCLDKLRDHRESDGRGGSYQVATPFLHANMLPTHSEYLPCIGGRDAASSRLRRDAVRACRVVSMASTRDARRDALPSQVARTAGILTVSKAGASAKVIARWKPSRTTSGGASRTPTPGGRGATI